LSASKGPIGRFGSSGSTTIAAAPSTRAARTSSSVSTRPTKSCIRSRAASSRATATLTAAAAPGALIARAPTSRVSTMATSVVRPTPLSSRVRQ
jgi:hypothetical protein